MYEVHVEAQSCNLGQTGGTTAPPSCQTDEIRTKSNSDDRTISDLPMRKHFLPYNLKKKKKILEANMSSLCCSFSYADVPSGAFSPVLIFLFGYSSVRFMSCLKKNITHLIKIFSITNAGDSFLAIV